MMSDLAFVLVICAIILIGVVLFSGCAGSDYAPPVRECGRVDCCKVCDVGEPCGDTCIYSELSCGKRGGCACSVVESEPCE